MMQRASLGALTFAILTGLALGQTAPQPGGSIQGVVFTTEQDHARSVVPDTKLSLDGTVHLETESNSEGAFAFSNLAPGSYTITAQAPGLNTSQKIEVHSGSVSEQIASALVNSLTA